MQADLMDSKAAAMNKMDEWRIHAYELTVKLCTQYGEKNFRVSHVLPLPNNGRTSGNRADAAFYLSLGTAKPMSCTLWVSTPKLSVPSKKLGI